MILTPLPLLLSALAFQGISTADEPAARIARVEAGLRPAILFAGDQGWDLEERMLHYGVPAVGIAVIHEGKIAWHKVYGKSNVETGAKATTKTLFQAASISKPLTAMAVLKLAAAQGISVDEDVNARLVDWKLPSHQLTEKNPATVACLLSHRGGTTVHGFGGYSKGAAVPTVVDILDGKPPANSPAVRVAWAPNQDFHYSGGGYTIVQKWMLDVSGKPFSDLMEELVLAPAGMQHSTYAQPLPLPLHSSAAAGVLPTGIPVAGHWHTYPEQAAAGLWTTAEDLARLAIEVQSALKGESDVLSRELAERMVPRDRDSIALGFFMKPSGGEIYFGHGGWNEGFSSELIAHRDAGFGAVVMTNGNQPDLINEILQGIRMEYDWPATKIYTKQPAPVATLESITGRYRFDAEQALTLRAEGQRLVFAISKGPETELVYVGDGVFVHPGQGFKLTFHETQKGLELRVENMGVYRRLADDERMPRELLLEGHFEEALGAYKAILADNPEEGSVSEVQLNTAGYEVLAQDRTSDAILLFRLVAALYPKSANAWDSLGEGYRALGDTPRSIEAYKAALKIDSSLPTAIQALAEMKGE